MFEFSQRLPPPDLRPWVRLIWTMQADAADNAEPVVPDGCAELIFNLGAPFQQRAPGDTLFREQPSSILNGQLRAAIMLRSTGSVHLVGVRLQPWALGALAQAPANSFTDSWQPLHAAGRQLLPDLEDALRNGIGRNLVASDIVVQHVRAHVARLKAPDSRLARLVAHVATTASFLDLSAARRQVGMSERAIQRVFASEVGLTTKQFSRVVRVQGAVQMRRLDARMTWVRAAMDAGYYDQSHFIKDFRSVVGCAPTELMVEPESMTERLLSDVDSQ